MSKKNQIVVQNIEINISTFSKEDYICLTDMARAKEGIDRANIVIQNWLRNRNTVEFIGLWEQINNPNFKGIEFDAFKSMAGLNSFVLTPKQWIEKTNAIGITSKSGRYGGTFAHKDIAFEFGSWISPIFKLYLIKEYQRLKDFETNHYNLEWNVKRILSKANYHIHTDAIKNYVLPKISVEKQKEAIIYAEEADILNLSLFGCTAKQWKELNEKHNSQGLNIRDIASINELAVLSNLENLNAEWMKENFSKEERFIKLKQLAVYQLEILGKHDFVKNLKKDNLKLNIDKNNESI
jgi:KilA-N domain